MSRDIFTIIIYSILHICLPIWAYVKILDRIKVFDEWRKKKYIVPLKKVFDDDNYITNLTLSYGTFYPKEY